MMRKFTMPAAVLLAVGMVSAAFGQNTEVIAKKDFAKLIEKDAIVYVSVRDVATLRGKLDAAGLKDLLDNAQVKTFLDYVKSRAEEEGGAQDNPLKDVSFSEILDAAEGEVALAVGALDIEKMIEDGADGGTPPTPDEIYFLVNAKGKAEDFQKLVTKVTDFAVDKGARKTEESYKGATITLYEGEGENQHFAIARVGSIFAVAPSVEGIKTLIKRSGEESADSLATNEKFRELSKAVGPEADALVYVNLEPLVLGAKKAIEEGGAGGQFGPMGDFIEPMFEGVGLDSVKAWGAGLTVKSDRIDFKMHLNAPSGLKGMLKSIFPRSENPTVPDFAAKGSHVFYTTQVDFPGLYQSILDDLLAPVAEQSGMDPEMMIDQMEAMLGIDVQDDLFDNLTGQITVVSKYEGTESVGVTALGVKNAKKFQDAFNSVMDVAAQQAPDMQYDEEEYLGGTVYTFGEGQVGMGIKDKGIFIGPTDSVKEAFRLVGKDEPTVADNETFQALKELLPERYQSLGFIAKDGLVKTLKDIKSGEFFKNLPAGPDGVPVDPSGDFDLSKIPDAEVLTKNLEGFVGYTATGDEGVTWGWTAKLKGR